MLFREAVSFLCHRVCKTAEDHSAAMAGAGAYCKIAQDFCNVFGHVTSATLPHPHLLLSDILHVRPLHGLRHLWNGSDSTQHTFWQICCAACKETAADTVKAVIQGSGLIQALHCPGFGNEQEISNYKVLRIAQ